MSQRLYIGHTDKTFYDCVLDSAEGAYEKLRDEWLVLGDGYYLGPRKVWINDKQLYREIEPAIERLYSKLNIPYPEDITFYFYNEDAPHRYPSREELNALLANEH